MTHVLIASARFYEELSDELEAGAIAAVKAAGATYELVTVPGALEVPAAIALGIESFRFDAYVALGVVIRGETSHYETVCNESARGLTELSLSYLAPIGNGILTVENMGQALERARTTHANKGGGAAEAALAVLKIKSQFGLLEEEVEA